MVNCAPPSSLATMKAEQTLDFNDPDCCHCDSMSIRSASPEPSLYSFSSSRDGHILRELHSRTLNSLCETYMLPSDEPEFQRQNREHDMWSLQFDGALCLRQDILDNLLAQPHQGTSHPKAVLDLGSGSGAWLHDMAIRYPWVDFTGVDLAPQTSGPSYKSLPDNVTIEIDDINLGLTHWENQFDVVHVRSIAMGVHNYKGLLEEIHHILRPGGIALLTEPDFELFHDNGDVLEAAFEDKPSGSWMARSLFEAYQALRRRGATMEAGLMHERWLHDVSGFTDIHVEKIYNPIGPWMDGPNPDETKRLRQIGELMQLNARDLIMSLRPLMLADGFFEKTVDMMFGRARYEISDVNLHRTNLHLFSKWHCAYARKR